MTIAAGIVTYFTNDNDCHATNSCPNECKYCTYGEMGDLELKINEFEQNGFSLTIPNSELDASMLAAELVHLVNCCHILLHVADGQRFVFFDHS